jgi:hypothetical protein
MYKYCPKLGTFSELSLRPTYVPFLYMPHLSIKGIGSTQGQIEQKVGFSMFCICPSVNPGGNRLCYYDGGVGVSVGGGGRIARN